MKELILTNSDKVALINDEDYMFVILHSFWHCLPKGYVRSNNGKNIYLHHFIAARMGLKDYVTIDHKNRNPFDNQRDNLKAATYSENLINTKIRSDNSNGFRFIVWSSQKNKWQVEISREKFRKNLGFFETIEEAVNVRDKYLSFSNLKVGDL